MMKKNLLRLTLAIIVFTSLLLMLYQPAGACGPVRGDSFAHRWIRASEGGVLQAGNVTLTIPAGALDRDRVVVMHVRDRGDKGEVTVWPGTALNSPATLNFGRSLSVAYYFDRGTWIPIYPAEDGLFYIDHFSRFGWW